jgi:hypothetical protein
VESKPAVQKQSAADLVSFWEWAGNRGLLARPTALARRTAVKEVFSVTEPDGWESLDVTRIDVGDLLDRFETISSNSRKLTPQSLATYKSRFKSAVQDYLAYQSNPGGWRPQRRGGRPTGPTNPVQGSGSKPTGRTAVAGGEPSSASASGPWALEGVWETYRFPIRRGLMATLSLPTDLRIAEVQRLAAFLETLVVEEDRAGLDVGLGADGLTRTGNEEGSARWDTAGEPGP